MSACGHDRLMLQALVDGELDAVHAAEIEAQIDDCADCAGEKARLLALRQALQDELTRASAPESLRRRLAVSLANAQPTTATIAPPASIRAPVRPRPWAWMGAGAGLAFAACAGLFVVAAQLRQGEALTRDLVASHVRSLQAEHLFDVATSDQHVVKPWFAGKLDFSPPVVELADQGFPLAGWRLDYVDGRAVAAIVYRRGRHVINLFVWPDDAVAAAPFANPGDGYRLRHWRAGGLSFWAVSDVNPADLDRFEADFRARAVG